MAFDNFFKIPKDAPESICDYSQVYVPWRDGTPRDPDDFIAGGNVGFLLFDEGGVEKVIPTEVFKVRGIVLEPRQVYPLGNVLGRLHALWVSN